MSEKLEKICVWKKCIEDENSTSGQGMRESNGRAKRCVECKGSQEYAESIGCSCYIEYSGRENDTR
tara:strand:- start:1811 stop:2008 length:198 start_codon:yes stop_codon:yes gene_type:complete